MGFTVFNGTMQKFGAPDTIIRQYSHWSVLLRPAQLTLGALVLVAHDPVLAFSELSVASFNELHQITQEIDHALKSAFSYDKLNYLMLMMVDPDVHFHVIPRYANSQSFEGQDFIDAGWPGVPNFSQINQTDNALNRVIIQHITKCWKPAY